MHSPLSAVAIFKRYLMDCYSRDGEEGQGEWPLLSNVAFIDPELLMGNSKVDIRDMFEDRNVLLEGTAGPGKTTLMRHICSREQRENCFVEWTFSST